MLGIVRCPLASELCSSKPVELLLDACFLALCQRELESHVRLICVHVPRALQTPNILLENQHLSLVLCTLFLSRGLCLNLREPI